MESYKYLAAVYDDLMYDVDYTAWSDYLYNFLKQKKVKTIFEAACGTGNITRELYRLGFDIAASDISPSMLGIASSKAKKSGCEIKFVRQDMRSIEVGSKVDAIVCACDGPNYIDTHGLESFANSSYNALAGNGLLLFDISTKHKLKDIMNGQIFFDDNDDSTCIWQNTYNTQNDTLLLDLTIFVRQGGLFERFSEQHIQYAHDIDTVFEVMKSAGFKVIDRLDCFTSKKFNKFSDRVQFICNK